MSETTPAIHEALAAVMDDVKAVAKSERNDSQRFNFRGIDSVVNAVGPALRTHGVVVLPNVLDHRYDTITSRGGSLMGHVVVTVRYDFVGPAGDMLSCTVVGESMDVGDKATPKAMSVAFRIALLQALTLPTDEPDPDSQTYERGSQAAPAKAEGADDDKVSGLVDAFAAVETEEDLQRVSDTIAGLDVGDQMRDILRGAYREALQRVKASTAA
jgi:hypothetical protein